jgi:endonuclease/exonuclease/phosphatase family metal-dependent hydrolase
MNIISLNTWGGIVYEPLMHFFEERKCDIDIFCLQEVLKDATGKDLDSLTNEPGSSLSPQLYRDIQERLPNHIGYFISNVGDYFGNAIFVHKDIEVLSHGEVLLYETPCFPDPENPFADHDRKAQWIILKKGEVEYCVVNVHGHWTDGKKDTPHRIEQSKRLVDLLSAISIPKIVCGDFNVDPDTESVRHIEKVGGLIDLIKKYNIQTTRTKLYTGMHAFADYIFASPILVENNAKYSFEVLTEEVSDHAGLRFEIR